MNNNRGVEGMKNERERKRYWSIFIDSGICLIFSATTLLIGFQKGRAAADNTEHKTAVAMAITCAIGLLSYFSSMFFIVGSVPFAILASFGASSNIMLMFFMAVHAGWPKSSKFHFMPEVALGVLTLFDFIIMSWDSVKANVRYVSAKLVKSGSRCCESLDASVVPFFENQWAKVRGYFRVLFGAVNPTQEDLELARLDRDV